MHQKIRSESGNHIAFILEWATIPNYFFRDGTFVFLTKVVKEPSSGIEITKPGATKKKEETLALHFRSLLKHLLIRNEKDIEIITQKIQLQEKYSTVVLCYRVDAISLEDILPVRNTNSSKKL